MSTEPLAGECRICFEVADADAGGRLIHPCSCSGSRKYIHERCLQHWREENEGREYSKRCEVCRTAYLIVTQHEPETFTIRRRRYWWEWFLLLIGFALTGYSLYETERHDGYLSLKPLGNRLYTQIVEGLHTDTIMGFSYYSLMTTYVLSLIYYASVSLCVQRHIKRRSLYWKKQRRVYVVCMAFASNYFLLYVIYATTQTMFLYLTLGPLFAVLDILAIDYFIVHHNKAIEEMNTRDNEECVMSVEECPLIATREIEQPSAVIQEETEPHHLLVTIQEETET